MKNLCFTFCTVFLYLEGRNESEMLVVLHLAYYSFQPTAVGLPHAGECWCLVVIVITACWPILTTFTPFFIDTNMKKKERKNLDALHITVLWFCIFHKILSFFLASFFFQNSISPLFPLLKSLISKPAIIYARPYST